MTDTLEDLVAAIQPVDATARTAARARHMILAKPPGSLGGIEDVGAQLAAISGTCPPPVPRRTALIVGVADHGVHAEGVSPWPQAITTAVGGLIAGGRSGAAVLAGHVGASVTVVDVGAVDPLPSLEKVVSARVRAGTRNLRVEPAMSRDEALAAIAAGARATLDLVASGADLIVTGDMGIANTTASACLVAAVTGAPADLVTGRGTGIDDETLAVKQTVVADALARHGEDRDPLSILASLGGLEHACLVGTILAGARARLPVLLDGLIANAAALVAVRLAPPTIGYLLAGHRSPEPGSGVALDWLGLTPLLDLDLRLGEGTGALLALPLVQAAALVLADMATIDEVVGPT